MFTWFRTRFVRILSKKKKKKSQPSSIPFIHEIKDPKTFIFTLWSVFTLKIRLHFET